jgi:hypothetical protein
VYHDKNPHLSGLYTQLMEEILRRHDNKQVRTLSSRFALYHCSLPTRL